MCGQVDREIKFKFGWVKQKSWEVRKVCEKCCGGSGYKEGANWNQPEGKEKWICEGRVGWDKGIGEDQGGVGEVKQEGNVCFLTTPTKKGQSLFETVDKNKPV